MEVAKLQDRVTHVVMGGVGKAIDFQIDNSPEFLHHLSSTLYKNQKLAVVRETLCNAWDAHIEAGATNTFVEVELTNEHLLIRDFGNGIPHDKIGDVYGRYGGSTKRDNGEVTGGFGLGCKAPFAYTEHFEVTSSNEGSRTIYRMTKSSAEKNGMPAIIPLATFPTTESGLAVKIPINAADYHEFAGLIEHVVYNGDMKVKLNTRELPTLDFSNVIQNFLIVDKDLTKTGTNNLISIRYGNVIYPLEHHADIFVSKNEVEKLLQTISGHQNYRWGRQPDNARYLVLLAEPNSISITPSRESLSMQPHTVKKINELLSAFVAYTKAGIKQKSVEVLKQSIDNTMLVATPAALFNPVDQIPNLRREKRSARVDNIGDISRVFLSNNYPDALIAGFKQLDYMSRINGLLQAGVGNRGWLQTLRAELLKGRSNATRWFRRRVVYPMIRDLTAAQDMNPNQLTIYGRELERDGGWRSGHRRPVGDPKFQKAMWYERQTYFEYLPMLRNIVVVAHNRTSVEERIANFPIFKHWMGNTENFFVYIAPRHVGRTETALKFFADRGMTVLDLTKVHPFEPNWVQQDFLAAKKAEAEPKKKKEKGLLKLSALVNATGAVITSRIGIEGFERIEKPKYVIQVTNRSDNGSIDSQYLSRTASQFIIERFGDETGIVINSKQMDKYKADGSIDLWDKIDEELKHYLQQPAVVAYHQSSAAFYSEKTDRWSSEAHDLLCTLLRSKMFREYWNLPLIPADPAEAGYWNMWRTMEHHSRRYGKYSDTHTHLQDLPLADEVLKLDATFKSSKLLKTFDASQIETILGATQKDEQLKREIRDLILICI